MTDPYFYCYRCCKHHKHEYKADQQSPSGKPMCQCCADKIVPKGVSRTKAPKKLSQNNIDYLAVAIQ